MTFRAEAKPRPVLDAAPAGISPGPLVKDALMRMQHWATALMSLLGPLVVCTTALAQPTPTWPSSLPGDGYPYTAAYPPDPALSQTPMVPPVFQPAYSTNAPQMLYPPGMPADQQPWPALSPHLGPNVMQDRTFQRHGAWLNQKIFRKREWYGTIEYLHTDFEGPGESRIGSRTIEIDRVTDDFPYIDTWPDGGPIVTDFNIVPLGPGAFPYVVMQQTEGTPFVGVAITEPEGLFPIRTTEILDDVLSAHGFRIRGGYFDNDGTGLGLEVWWGFDGDDYVQYGQDTIRGIPITQNLIAGIDLTNFPFPTTYPPDAGDFNDYGGFLLSAKVGALPLEDSSGVHELLFPATGITGSTQKYDLLYRVDIQTSAGGGNLNFFLGDIYRRPHVQIKPYTGLKYLYVDERFRFRGLDSGFHYEVDVEGADGAPTFRPADGTIYGPLYPLFESVLNSTVISHLAGPELGVRGDLGQSKNFNVWWQGAFGLMVNHERARVKGYNIGNAHYFNANFGDPTVDGDETGFGTIFGPAFDMFANDTRFDNVEAHTHVSPTFQLGINAEIGILDVIPGVRKISLFDSAKLNVGYNMLFIGLMAKAADSIRWRGFPDFPEPQIDYDTWQIHQISVGLHFER